MLLAVVFAAAEAAAAAGGATSCVVCHGDPAVFEGEDLAIAQAHPEDVHARVGLSCHDCHGGNPDPALADDDAAAMDEGFAGGPYVGAPARTEVPAFCGRCHSQPTIMRRYKPDARVDQEREYWTSSHGLALARGDTGVATCIDCHGSHDIQRVDAPESRVYPTRVAETCNGCHGDAEHMRGRTDPYGAPLPVDQFARWRQSVHAQALLEREDLSSPTCNDCHGNHGATPPGLESVAFVCGQCHGREAEIFRVSPKHPGFEDHNELLDEAGEAGCAECHESPQADLVGLRRFSECTTCHGNHGIVRPTLAMFSALPEIPCDFCHGEVGAGEVAEPRTARQRFAATRDRLLGDAASRGLEGRARFDWLIDRALELPQHAVEGPGKEERTLRAEFAMLFEKFRLGKSSYLYPDPTTAEPVRADVTRCDSCHEAGEPGARVGVELIERMTELTAMTARAERVVLAARRGGVETRDAAIEVDHAVASQIALEVLVHGFSVGADSAFVQQHERGLAHARAALEKGQAALDELAYRRRGLAVALGIIVLVLVALGLKIRQLSNGAG